MLRTTIVLACAVWPAVVAAQSPSPRDAPPRDGSPAREGTAVIKGRVTAADTGLPLGRAIVSLSGGPRLPPNASPTPGTGTVQVTPRNIATNVDGTFEFSALSAGVYRLRVTPGAFRAHYLPLAFGARGPVDVGKPVDLAAGEIVEANFTGMGSGQTDDRGRFRLYGLMPDEYIVSADPPNGDGSTSEFAGEGLAMTYFPSAFTEREAGRVGVAAGRETDVQISLIRTRRFSIAGTILDSAGRPLTSAQIVLAKVAAANQSVGSASFDGAGQFTVRGIAPGEYVLVVWPGSGPSEDLAAQKRPREFANVPLSVTTDITDLVVVTRPGGGIAGQVVFAEGAPSRVPPTMRVLVQQPPGSSSFTSPPQPPVGPDLRFRLTELVAKYQIRLIGMPAGYVLKAVTLGGADITDQYTEFKPENSQRLEVVLTSRSSILEGTVADDRGDPASEVSVIILPENKASWKFGSPRTRITTASDGKFRLEGVLAGRYQVLAIPRDRLRPSADLGPPQFEPFLKDATVVVLGESDTKTVALRVARGPED